MLKSLPPNSKTVRRMSKRIWALILILGACAAAHAESAPYFSRLFLSKPPTGGQPSVTHEPERGFIVTWQRSRDDTTSLHWLALDLQGHPTGEGLIAEGKNWFVNWADTPSLIVLDNGDWVAFWLERNDPELPEGYDIRLVRSTDRGKSWSKPLAPHRDGTKTQHGFVSMIADGDDRVLISWLDGRRAASTEKAAAEHDAHDHEGAPMTLRSAVVDRTGALSDELEIDERTCSCCQTDMSRWGRQRLIAYRDRSEDEIRDISVALKSSDGWGLPKRIHDDHWRIEGCPVNGPAITSNGSQTLVFWPTLVNEQMALRYILAESPEQLTSKPAMHELRLPTMPSGRVDAVPWRDGFSLIWVSRARDRPAVEYAYVDPSGKLEFGKPIAEPALRGRATGFPRAASDGKSMIVVWPELDNGIPVIGMALAR